MSVLSSNVVRKRRDQVRTRVDGTSLFVVTGNPERRYPLPSGLLWVFRSLGPTSVDGPYGDYEEVIVVLRTDVDDSVLKPPRPRDHRQGSLDFCEEVDRGLMCLFRKSFGGPGFESSN